MSNSPIEETRPSEPSPENSNVQEIKKQAQLEPNEVEAMNSLHLEEALEIFEKKTLTKAEKKIDLTHLLHRATSSGDSDTVKALLSHKGVAELIDVDAKDEEGSPPLIYAACFGYAQVVKALIIGGATVNVQDKNGWPPLMWAMSNKHEEIVKILLENGASPSTKTAKGRTVLDIINHGLTNTDKTEKSAKLQEILSYNHQHRTHQSMASFSSFSYADYPEDDSMSMKSWAYTDPEGHERDMYKANNDKLGQLELLGNDLEELMNSENYGYNEDSLNELTNDEFVWDQCLPDQMFVFSSTHIPHIIGTVITTMSPLYAKDQKSVPANVIFLCSRFALYFSTPDLLEDLLKAALKAISDCVKAHHNDIKYLAFWLANCSQLLYYLKKDTGLVGATVDPQLSLSELIHEIYQFIVRDTQSKISAELESSILECDSIPGLSDESKFQEKKKGFFSFARTGEKEENDLGSGRSSLRKRLSLRRNTPNPIKLSRKRHANPEIITDILTQNLSVLQTYQVHPMLTHHLLNQMVYFITSELFNRILDARKYCSRTRAMQIRMNVTVLEDWIRRNSSSPIVSNLTFHFKSLLHLLQLLQCFSAHRSLAEFQETLLTLDTLTPLQIQLIAETYRYENDEEPLPEEVTEFIQNSADLVIDRKHRSANMLKDGRNIVVVRDLDDQVSSRIARRVSFLEPSANSSSRPNSRANSRPSSPPLLQDKPSAPTHRVSASLAVPVSKSMHSSSKSLGYSPGASPILSSSANGDSNLMQFFQYSEFSVFKDPNHLLPFSVPTQSDMANGWSGTSEGSGSPRDPLAGESYASPESPTGAGGQINEHYVPTIPESFVDLLDVNNLKV